MFERLLKWTKGSKGGGRGASRRKPKAEPWDPKRTLVGAKVLVAVAGFVAAVVGWRALETQLHEYAAERHGRPASAEMIVLQDAPAWMSSAVQDELRLVVASRLSPDPMSGRSLRIAALTLNADPWVRQVHQLQRHADGAITVQAEYRQPVAMIECGDGYRLVDREGVSLPGLYSPVQARQLGMPTITGVTQQPPSPGGVWSAADVQAGIDLVLALAEEPYVDQIEAYDVSHRDSRGRVRLVLYTAMGMVRWGLPPGEEQTIEPETPVKISWLRHVYQTRGAIDAGGKVVDIYGARIAVYNTVDASRRTGL